MLRLATAQNAERLEDHVKEVDCLYNLVLGRPVESASVAEGALGVTAKALLASLVGSDEFRVRVAGPLLHAQSPDPAWMAGSRTSPLAARRLRAAGAKDTDFLELDDPLKRLAGVLSVPAAQAALCESVGQPAAAQILQALTTGHMSDVAPPQAGDAKGSAAPFRPVQSADIRNLYRIVLAREPEAGVLENEVQFGLRFENLWVGVVSSPEFLSNFIIPSASGGRAAPGYYRPVSSDLCDWIARLGFASATRAEIDRANTIGELVDRLLRDEALPQNRYPADVKIYLEKTTLQSNPWRMHMRPELSRLKVADYPRGFNWHAYLQHNPGAGDTRWEALAHLLETTDPMAGLPPTFEEGGADFLAALGSSFVGRQDKYAARLLHAASCLRPLSAAEAEDLGDALIHQDLGIQGLTCYLEAIEKAQPTLSLMIKAAKTAISLYRIDDSLDLLRRTKAVYGEQPPWKALLLPYFEAKLRTVADLAFASYRLGDRAAGDAALTALVQELEAQVLELHPLGLPLPADGLKRVLLFSEVGLPQCKHYRVDQRRAELTALGFRPEQFVLGEHDRVIERLAGAEALIVYRYPAWPTIILIIILAKSLGIPVFYEIDDLIFDTKEYPDSYESYGGQINFNTYINLQFGVPLFKAAAQLCDYAIASTEPLAGELRKIVRSGQAWVVPNSLDDRIETMVPSQPASQKDGVTIVYGTGTRAHNADFDDLVAPALLRILNDHPDVRLLVIGYLTLPPEFDAYLSRIIKIDFVEPVEAYWQLLASADINIAVLNPSLMADCKSEIKWLEAAAFSIPSIVSPTAAYRQALTAEQDVLFADTPQAWYDAFDRLIVDPALRRRIGEAAKATAHGRFSQQAAAGALATALEYARAHRPTSGAKPKLMLANVYFPPQTIGGATRVLKDNIDAFIEFGLCDDFDLAILTTDVDVQPAGKLSIDSYRGLPVFRISTPHEVNMDWRPSNPAVGALFARIYDLWKPDIVHFHCIQRLTGSVVDICRRNYTPYLITAHDAWWISDYQFLTDDKNQLVDPSAKAHRPPPPAGVTQSQSRNRSLYLKSLLEGAEAVLAVSNSFAEVYRSAGVQNVRPVANGLPRLDLRPRRPSPDGRVRLAHVGNVTVHKGFPLLRQALLEGRFPNLRLTVVDHSRRPGEVRTETWGETEVQIVGPCSQDAMPAFYAEHDVLVAPSTWPESFGLVTREALAAGLWVIASDRGAVSEDVRPGVNGFIVKVETAEPLQKVLGLIDASPQTYLTPPPPTPLRSADDQARDLMSLYRDLFATKVARREGGAGSIAIDGP
jgi:glycosyltransferase involved in cell wall biosynthesis